MKSCPKCNRTFPDEGQKFCTFDGGLLIAPQPFDPNMTIRATAADVNVVSEKTTSRELPDPNATIAEQSNASTIALPRNTAPTTAPDTSDFARTVASIPVPPPISSPDEQTVALPSLPARQAAATVVVPPPSSTGALPVATAAAPAPAKKKSKLPLIILGVLVVLLFGGGAVGAFLYFFVKPRLEAMSANSEANKNQPVVDTNKNTNTETKPVVETPTPKEETYVPPLGTTAFENSKERLEGKLAEHYFDFSFYYPESWQKDPAGASSFVKVERRLPPDFTQENFTVGWYTSAGTFEDDLPNYPRRVEELSGALSKNIPEYRKVSEGPTNVNSMKAYEFRWVGFSKNTEQGDLKLWGRVIFLPTGQTGDTTGATLTMLSTSLATELSSVDDLGVKGEAPVILESFRFGKKK